MSNGALRRCRTGSSASPIVSCGLWTIRRGSRSAPSAKERRGRAPPTSPRSMRVIRSQDLNLAAFKGQKVTFRAWDGQLRQPIIVTGPDLPVSVSPQPGFLHEEAEVDTLGVDEPETKCKFK